MSKTKVYDTIFGKKTSEELYLYYINDFLTVSFFADYFNLSLTEVGEILRDNMDKRAANKRREDIRDLIKTVG